MSTIKVDTVRPVTTDGSLTLQGDSSGAGVTGITIDSSGNITLNGTANNLGTVTAGTLGALVNHKIYTHTHNSSSGLQSTDPYNFGTSLTISSADNTAGAKFLILSSGGRFYCPTGANGGQKLLYKESSDFTSSTEGTDISYLSVPYTDASDTTPAGTVIGTYTNTGSATNLYVRTAVFSGSGSVIWNGTDIGIAIIAIRIS